MKRGSRSAVAAVFVLLAALAWGAGPASAEIVRTPNGQFLGVLPHQGVAAGSIPGSLAAQNAANGSPSGDLTYHGGPVAHSSAAYVVFWSPSGFSIPAGSQSLLKRYFSDAAADSGTSGNAFAVARQFTDGSGFANYMQTFNSSAQAISDSQAFPTLDSAHCPKHLSGETYCVTDAQIQAELQRLIASGGLPTDGSASASSLPANAPIYFVVLPQTVNVCDTASSCADNIFCAYHSSFTDTGNNILYATIPFLAAAQFPKGCQMDGNMLVQKPNGDPLGDVALKFLSHEHNEVITDPTGRAWYDGASGNENGDNCNAAGANNPHGGTSPNAFLPVLGGSAAAQSLYDQRLAGNSYYLQSEWSNGDTGCEMAPTPGTVVPSFTAPSSSTQGSPASFDPGASTSANTLSSATWDFGDGTATTFRGAGSPLASVSHTYGSSGTYTVKLTLVDNRGNLAATTKQIIVDEAPSAAFTPTPSHPAVGQSVSFNGSSSSDPDGSIVSYSWNFGDGTPAATGVTATHSYTTSGTYAVTLTVTDSSGGTATTTRQLPVGLIASFTVTSPPPLLQGQAIGFDGTGSSTSQGRTITSYSWDFGDNSPLVTGPSPSHAYLHYGSYTVKLTVTDSIGAQDTAVQTVVVHQHPPTAGFIVATAIPVVGQPVAFDGSSSSDPDGPITSYSWTFGDGSTGTGAMPSHMYAAYGVYSVALTVTVGDGQIATTTRQIVVHGLPIATFAVATSAPTAGQPVAFDGSGSRDPTASIVSYAWTFGDGGMGAGATPRHIYSRYGTYTVTLTVADSSGLAGSVSRQVVIDAAPIASFTFAPRRPPTGTPVAFDATSSSDPANPIISYKWSFGDGGVAAGARPRHVYRKAGNFRVALTVADRLGTSTTALKLVRVTLAGRITRLTLHSARTSATLAVSVSSAGVLSAGHRSIRLRHSGSVAVRIELSAKQVRKLSGGGSVTIHLALRFSPHQGRSSRQRVTVVFHLPPAHGRRVYARLQR